VYNLLYGNGLPYATGWLQRENTMKRISIKQEACIGCGLCQVYCTVEHSKSKDLVKAYLKENPKPVSRARVETNKPNSISIRCQHCKDTPCVNACLTGAMTKETETGHVLHNPEKCIGCWTCIMVCPYAAVKPDSSGKIIAKCDLCPDREIPACVENCPNEALVLEEVEQ
jgi:carbon-monoxide dehydrogenase iron sulfur subunit